MKPLELPIKCAFFPDPALGSGAWPCCRYPTGGGTLSERLYVQQDANWNVTAVVNTSGVVVERYAEDPFGQVTYLTPTWATQSGSTVSWTYLHQGLRFDPGGEKGGQGKRGTS
jgi:hypothetical protein